MRPHDGADSTEPIVLADGMDLQRTHVEHQSVVVNRCCRNLADRRMNRHLARLSHAEQIEVSCRPVPLADADSEEHRSFQDELFSES